MIAIVVSLISICVASLSLGWNIYRDIGLKPRVFVKFGVTYLDFHEDRKSLAISVTNLGRISITVNAINIKERSFWRNPLKKTKYGYVQPDKGNSISDKLPKKLEAGEDAEFLLPYYENCLLKESLSHIGLQTSFGKIYWTKTRDMKKARKLWLEDFGHNET